MTTLRGALERARHPYRYEAIGVHVYDTRKPERPIERITGTIDEPVEVYATPVECECVHAPEWHDDRTGPCRARLYDSLGTDYAECTCPWYVEAPDVTQA